MENIENKQKEYPILYYDIKTALEHPDLLENLWKQLHEYFSRENVPFIMLPNLTQMNFMNKKDLLKKLYAAIEEVEAWD